MSCKAAGSMSSAWKSLFHPILSPCSFQFHLQSITCDARFEVFTAVKTEVLLSGLTCHVVQWLETIPDDGCSMVL